LVLIATTAGCSLLPFSQVGPALARSDVPRASADPAAAIDAASSVNAFGFDLYRAVEAGQGVDVVISPASVAIALAMARAGARGETATQMDTVLRSLGADQGAAAINALDQALSSRSGTYRANDGHNYDLTLTVANAPYAQRDEAWQQPFLDALAQRFGAGVRLVDYRTDAEGARQQINSWVDDQTHQRIPELIGPGVLDALTRLVLVNAIYLKAPWATPFDPQITKPGTFTHLDGSTVEVPMMAMSDKFSYAEGAGWRAVELPYVGDSLAMTIVVPDNLADFVRGLDADSFAQVTSALSTHEVVLTMPRFNAETKANLADLLAQLGMPLAFDPDQADFSGMTTQDQLYISDVIHQANISVDEKGTEAAAATAVVMEASAAPGDLVTLNVDRPFVFALRDLSTGAILFLGQIVDPAAS
jgi:serpin B